MSSGKIIGQGMGSKGSPVMASSRDLTSSLV
eukprot:CAMPEP_0194511558 /NCGR_PEP_ID=MMETSP0253-20130528/43277_1 /TAXON_ID=2966 /ORGANISM="Noctiluca scintillans" /LENGTH=30 /DNA_ID= /DNA_START= /DNA_END= /DNA_ORIENTATION=